MNDFINERDGLEIFDEIYKMETLINTINVMLNKTDTVKEKQQKFIQRHQDFLHNQGLNYLLDKNASEHLKTLL
jgi:FtsZ-binding cell division protein ZapB